MSTCLPFTQRWDYSRDGTLRSIDDSLQRLGLERIDYAFIHDVARDAHGDAQPADFARRWKAPCRRSRSSNAKASSPASGSRQRLAVCVDALAHADLDILLVCRALHAARSDGAPDAAARSAPRAARAWCSAGRFNSGILATGTRPPDGRTVYFNYAPANAEVLERARAIEALCAAHRVSLKAAALQFLTRASGNRMRACRCAFARGARRKHDACVATDPRRVLARLARTATRRRRSATSLRYDAVSGSAMRIDAHHHVWQLDRGDYGWLTRALAPIYRDFTLDDLRPLLARVSVAATVLVQAAPTVAETEFLAEGRARERRPRSRRRRVGRLTSADASATLVRLARDPLLKSIRPMLQDIADPSGSCAPTSIGRSRPSKRSACASMRS
jgi:hypothetical protein